MDRFRESGFGIQKAAFRNRTIKRGFFCGCYIIALLTQRWLILDDLESKASESVAKTSLEFILIHEIGGRRSLRKKKKEEEKPLNFPDWELLVNHLG